MRDETAQTLLAALGEQKAREILNEFAKQSAIREFDRMCHTNFAASLLRQKVSRPVIRERLMTAYQLSERTAYRIICDALNTLRQNTAINGS